MQHVRDPLRYVQLGSIFAYIGVQDPRRAPCLLRQVMQAAPTPHYSKLSMLLSTEGEQQFYNVVLRFQVLEGEQPKPTPVLMCLRPRW